jgi:hypothetical protein
VVDLVGDIVVDVDDPTVRIDGFEATVTNRSFQVKRYFKSPGEVDLAFELRSSGGAWPALRVRMSIAPDPEGEEEVGSLIRMLDSEIPARVLITAVSEVRERGDLRVVGPLLNLFERTVSLDLRWEILYALQHLRAVDAVPTLFAAMHDERLFLSASLAFWSTTGHASESLHEFARDLPAPGSRAKAVARWQRWFEDNEQSLRVRLHQPRD